MKVFIRVLAVSALLVSIGWLYFEPGFEPILTTIVSLSALISTFIFENKSKTEKGQKQTVKKNSSGIQVGGNFSINSNDTNKED